MKILYAIQGTGNGHISRAIEMIPHFQKKGEVDILISGAEWELKFPFLIQYRFGGLTFVFGKNGGIDMVNTYMKLNSFRMLREIKSLPIENYDLVISDFEPVSAWAAHLKKVPCIGLSNQSVTLHPLAPKPKKTDRIGKMILENYAPVTRNYGFHFKQFDEKVFTPVIRSEVRNTATSNKGHITVYLPAYSDERILKHLRNFDKIEWQVFSKHNKKEYKEKNISVQPILNETFIKSMAESAGVLCNAGFGTASEALYLQKKLLVIPMKSQYEQHCNAAVLKSMGVPVMKSLKKKHRDKLAAWLEKGNTIKVNYPDNGALIADKIIKDNYKINYTPFDASEELFQ